MDEVQDFQQRLYEKYMNSLKLPAKYSYLFGNPIEPVVPIDTATNAVIIIGAYPSARFATIKTEIDVPIGDILAPFSSDRYFDGSRVRSLASSAELEQDYLRPLVSRQFNIVG